MTLSELKKGECGEIIKVSANQVLKSRLNSFGITKGAKIYVIEQTMSKNTIEIRLNSTKIALRTNEAKTIEIERRECEI
ncbi:FeoA family protein [Arcobacter nitrofigilis DSM 7299]|uniref:FeoA family protein n=1 Tax=Arcobacter nitrofigilis (strain ATCC 33309 / DSM 7299 / CCUG 15893 / LMG 7604 / NCTC 12251 / CI) TaxID=572480 RepID=D5UZ95_ARCNC|nr:FeoA family protein [Arcobacter nitrofigilis]ADG94098.1 FeoA family protein [Arcobacter nitrofigilis DSM 7299]